MLDASVLVTKMHKKGASIFRGRVIFSWSLHWSNGTTLVWSNYKCYFYWCFNHYIQIILQKASFKLEKLFLFRSKILMMDRSIVRRSLASSLANLIALDRWPESIDTLKCVYVSIDGKLNAVGRRRRRLASLK